SSDVCLPASPAGRAERMHMHMCIERTASVAFVIDRGSRKLETPERIVPPGGRSLAPCLTWRQAATNHHDSVVCPEHNPDLPELSTPAPPPPPPGAQGSGARAQVRPPAPKPRPGAQ